MTDNISILFKIRQSKRFFELKKVSLLRSRSPEAIKEKLPGCKFILSAKFEITFYKLE